MAEVKTLYIFRDWIGGLKATASDSYAESPGFNHRPVFYHILYLSIYTFPSIIYILPESEGTVKAGKFGRDVNNLREDRLTILDGNFGRRLTENVSLLLQT